MECYNEYDPYRQPPIKVSGPLAMAYVPMQQFKDLYDPARALRAGTVFKELDLPFKGRRSCE